MRHGLLFSLFVLTGACVTPSPAATDEDAAVPDSDVRSDAGTEDAAVAAGAGGKAAGGSGGVGGSSKAGAGGAAGGSGKAGGASNAGGGGKAGSGGTGGAGSGGVGGAGSGGNNAGAGGAAEPKCVAGEVSCDDLDVITCSSSGTWQTTNTCPYVCDDGVCGGSCVPGAKQCSGLGAQTCSAQGVWVTDQTCPYVCSGGSCAGSCVPGATKCAGLTVQTCDASGIWQNAASACQYVCSAGACSGACQPSSMRCSGTNALDAQTCDSAGTWQTTQTCPYVCNGGSCSGACTPGARKCNGTVAQTCNASGQWATDQTCPYVCSGAGSCSGSCVPESMQCSGVGAQTCDSAGAWQTTATCPYACSSGNCIGVCVPGATRCSGAGTQTCGPTGQWQTAVACPSTANTTATCSGAGQCSNTCNTNFADCNGSAADGCEVSLLTDSNNCNACGRECCGDGVCSAGTCQAAVVLAGNWLRFDMDETNIYTVRSTDNGAIANRAIILKTPRAGGSTTTFVPDTITKGDVWTLVTDGTNLYWTSYEPILGSLDIQKTPIGGGATTPVTSGKSVHNVIHDGSDLIWSYNANTGVQWQSLTSAASGYTVYPASTYWMASDGQYLYYEEAVTTKTTCGGTNQNPAWTMTVKKVPVHGGTIQVLDSGCGQISTLAVVGSTLYYARQSSGPALADGMYSIPVSGGVAPTKITVLGASIVSDETNMYYCKNNLFKKPLSGGAEVTLVDPTFETACNDVKLSGQCVYYNGTHGITTVNKNP